MQLLAANMSIALADSSFPFLLIVVQYISLLFIGILIVISVRGFLTNLMKVILLSDSF